MSGKRTRALRKEFREITGRAAVTEVRKGVGTFFRSVFSRTLGKRTKEAFQQSVIIGVRNEFRRFKRAGKTELQIRTERYQFLRRRAARHAEIELNNERILDGRRRHAELA